MDYSPRDIELSEAILHELVDMGLISENSQIKMLFKQIPNCAEFIYCVGFYIGNRDLFGNLLDNLSKCKMNQRLKII